MDPLPAPPGSTSSSPQNRIIGIISVKHTHRNRRQAANSKNLWTTLSDIRSSQSGGGILQRLTRVKSSRTELIIWESPSSTSHPTKKNSYNIIPLPRISLDHKYSLSITANGNYRILLREKQFSSVTLLCTPSLIQFTPLPRLISLKVFVWGPPTQNALPETLPDWMLLCLQDIS